MQVASPVRERGGIEHAAHSIGRRGGSRTSRERREFDTAAGEGEDVGRDVWKVEALVELL